MKEGPKVTVLHDGVRPDAQPVIYAIDLGPRNSELRALYSSRRFYVYADGVLKPAD